MFLFLCENHVLMVLFVEHSDVDARFILCTSKIYTYVLNLKKSYFIFPIKKGSVNAHMKLVGFSTSNKVKNHCSSVLLCWGFEWPGLYMWIFK